MSGKYHSFVYAFTMSNGFLCQCVLVFYANVYYAQCFFIPIMLPFLEGIK